VKHPAPLRETSFTALRETRKNHIDLNNYIGISICKWLEILLFNSYNLKNSPGYFEFYQSRE
jgi:hypothetical protein